MNDPIPELTKLLDRDRIRDCLIRLARGEDRRNAELISGAFCSDATIDLGIFTGTFPEYLDWVVPGSPEIPVTQHVLGQSLIDQHEDTALAETHVLAYHRVNMIAGHHDSVIGGRYLDWMDQTGGTWRIGRRTMIYDWYQELGPSADWAVDGLMGMQFDTGRYTGKAVRDPSEDFLGDRWPPDETGGTDR